jgi:hypothetical protein
MKSFVVYYSGDRINHCKFVGFSILVLCLVLLLMGCNLDLIHNLYKTQNPYLARIFPPNPQLMTNTPIAKMITQTPMIQVDQSKILQPVSLP